MERIRHLVQFDSEAFLRGTGPDDRGALPLASWVATQLHRAGIDAGSLAQSSHHVDEDHFGGYELTVPARPPIHLFCGTLEHDLHEHHIEVWCSRRGLQRPNEGSAALAQRVVDALHAALAAHPDVHRLHWDRGGPSTT